MQFDAIATTKPEVMDAVCVLGKQHQQQHSRRIINNLLLLEALRGTETHESPIDHNGHS